VRIIKKKLVAIYCVIYTKDLQANENEAPENIECNICFENTSTMSHPYVISSLMYPLAE
jgi:hypothetical protein